MAQLTVPPTLPAKGGLGPQAGRSALSPTARSTLALQVDDQRWHSLLGRVGASPARLGALLWRTVLAAAQADRGAALRLAGPLNLLLTDDRTMKRLNRQFRGLNKPTNVLTFPAANGCGGDIVMGWGTVAREARGKGVTMHQHCLHLLAHGCLHLAGLDHHHPAEAAFMEGKESRVMRALGHANPWKASSLVTSTARRGGQP
ncbi:rRNA maturation RNase YbeY [Formicincola oecophyllae]|uniref:Endoribonuclease YbeY n=1 Tax=Formicincola oecophyllae TaxID=2558361 RepID=A0A4Y6U6D3_9PROT|nr:rRNA maturation RNase YbeY [Formicincola oecophyllae]QDH12902.1 rRNA maturation RNase YbeY [Formicincola oecophyllae]